MHGSAGVSVPAQDTGAGLSVDNIGESISIEEFMSVKSYVARSSIDTSGVAADKQRVSTRLQHGINKLKIYMDGTICYSFFWLQLEECDECWN
jgi:hypothetical protein